MLLIEVQNLSIVSNMLMLCSSSLYLFNLVNSCSAKEELRKRGRKRNTCVFISWYLEWYRWHILEANLFIICLITSHLHVWHLSSQLVFICCVQITVLIQLKLKFNFTNSQMSYNYLFNYVLYFIPYLLLILCIIL